MPLRRVALLASAAVVGAVVAAAPARASGGGADPAAAPDAAARAAMVEGACTRSCGCARRVEVALTLPVWVPSLTGTFASGDTEVDASRQPCGVGGLFEKLLPDAATSLEFAFMGRVEVAWGPWRAYADGFYVSLDETVDWKLRDEDTTGSLDGTVLRAFVAWQPDVLYGCSPCAPRLAVGPLLGARWFRLDLEAQRADGSQLAQDESWLDPIVGVKADLTFANGASVAVLADYGGSFDGDHTSWTLSAELAWPLDHRGRWSLRAGWSILDLDYEVGSGADEYDVNLHLTGPMLGVTYRF